MGGHATAPGPYPHPDPPPPHQSIPPPAWGPAFTQREPQPATGEATPCACGRVRRRPSMAMLHTAAPSPKFSGPHGATAVSLAPSADGIALAPPPQDHHIDADHPHLGALLPSKPCREVATAAAAMLLVRGRRGWWWRRRGSGRQDSSRGRRNKASEQRQGVGRAAGRRRWRQQTRHQCTRLRSRATQNAWTIPLSAHTRRPPQQSPTYTPPILSIPASFLRAAAPARPQAPAPRQRRWRWRRGRRRRGRRRRRHRGGRRRRRRRPRLRRRR